MASRAIAMASLVATALVAAGCGSSDDTNSVTDWANEVCTSVSSWTTSIADIGTSLSDGNLSQDSLTGAVDDATNATKTLVEDLERLGTPDIEAGDEAKSTIDRLASDLTAGVETIEDAVADISGVSDVVGAVTKVSSTLGTMGTQVGAAFESLERLDVRGELETAFAQADDCESLTS